jgi:hypothetical protein
VGVLRTSHLINACHASGGGTEAAAAPVKIIEPVAEGEDEEVARPTINVIELPQEAVDWVERLL